MIKKIDKTKITYIILAIITFLFFVCRISNIKTGKGMIILLSIVFFALLLLGYFLISKFSRLKIETLFLIFSITFGIFYIFGFPPSQLPDDSSDYFRSLEVSEFHLTTPKKDKVYGRSYSVNVEKVYSSKSYSDVISNMNMKLEGKKKLYTYTNKSLYSFVCYIPQAIGVGIANILKLPIVFQILLGKIFNFSFYVLAIYLAIKYIPVKKELIFFMSLLPISMQEATSLSADSMTIWATFSLFAFTMWSKIKEIKFTKRHYIILSLLLLFISLSKIVYLPLCFLILLIPTSCFKSKKQKIIYCCFVLFVSILFNMIWLKISAPYLDQFMSSRKSNSSDQLMYIISNPLEYVLILFNTVDKFLFTYSEQMIGYSLGAWTVNTSYIFAAVSLIMLLYMVVKNNRKVFLLNNYEKIFSFLILIGTTLLIFTSLYLQWTELRAHFVDGIQGRYFIPLIPIVSLLFMTKNDEEKINFCSLMIVIMFNIVALISIYRVYL